MLNMFIREHIKETGLEHGLTQKQVAKTLI